MTTRRGTCSPRQFDDIAAGQPIGDEITHYFVNVLRLSSGARVDIADGEGRVLSGSLQRQQGAWTVSPSTVTGHQLSVAPPTITLLVALLKPQRWRMVVEKSVELGISQLVPILTERTVIRPRSEKTHEQVIRWKRIAAGAANQSHRSLLPDISPPVSMAQALSTVTQPNRLVAALDPDGIDGLETIQSNKSTALLIGPEGGLTHDEVGFAVENGFHRVYLGPYTLRAETAAIVLITLVRQQTQAIQIESGLCQ